VRRKREALAFGRIAQRPLAKGNKESVSYHLRRAEAEEQRIGCPIWREKGLVSYKKAMMITITDLRWRNQLRRETSARCRRAGGGDNRKERRSGNHQGNLLGHASAKVPTVFSGSGMRPRDEEESWKKFTTSRRKKRSSKKGRANQLPTIRRGGGERRRESLRKANSDSPFSGSVYGIVQLARFGGGNTRRGRNRWYVKK